MSIFPKHTIPGGVVTFHVRYPGPRDLRGPIPTAPVLPDFVVSIHPPDGTRVNLCEWQPLLLPFTLPASMSDAVPRDEGIIKKKFPLLFVAELLQGPGRSKADLFELLDSIGNATHFYNHYKVPTNATPGRYRTLIEIFHAGIKTEKWNEFFVEWLELTGVAPHGNGMVATLLNRSPDPVPLRIVEVKPTTLVAGKYCVPAWQERSIQVPGDCSYKLAINTCKAFLLYASDVQTIPVSLNGDPFCVRNPRLPWITKEEEEVCLLPESDKDESDEHDTVFSLTGSAQVSWHAADGMTTRGEITAHSDEHTYTVLRDASMIREIPSGLNYQFEH